MPCSVCKQHGHNKRTCGQQKPEAKKEKKKKEKKSNKKQKKYKKKKACNKEHNKEQQDQKEEEQLKSHKDCAICLCECSKDEKCCQLECGHMFHTSCIFTWFEKHDTCPMCRMEVKQMKKEERKIRLPSRHIIGAMERMMHDMGVPVHELSRSQYVQAVYMMIKMRLESLNYNEYEELLALESQENDDPNDL